MTLEEQIRELKEIRKLLQEDRRVFKAEVVRLREANNQLRIEKQSLLAYIKELEAFNPVT